MIGQLAGGLFGGDAAGGEAAGPEGLEAELTALRLFGGDSDETWAERQRIWAEAIGMCKDEHEKFR